MKNDGQQITHQVYEDPDIVEGYIKRNAINPKQKDLIASFSKTIEGITSVAKNETKIYIRLKGGKGTLLSNEDKYGKEMQREFTLWSKKKFLNEVEQFEWKLDNFNIKEGSEFMGQPTQWLQFFFTVVK